MKNITLIKPVHILNDTMVREMHSVVTKSESGEGILLTDAVLIENYKPLVQS
jgi:hypothetical protein